MLFGMSRALSPTPPWNVRLNVGGTNTEFEYQNPRAPHYCSFRNWQVSHMSAQLLSNSKNKHASCCWEGEGGGMVFVLVWFSLTRYYTQKNVLFKHVNWQDCERSQTGVSWKESSFTKAFYCHSLIKPRSST